MMRNFLHRSPFLWLEGHTTRKSSTPLPIFHVLLRYGTDSTGRLFFLLMRFRFHTTARARLAFGRFTKISARLATTLRVREWHIVTRTELALLFLDKRI